MWAKKLIKYSILASTLVIPQLSFAMKPMQGPHIEQSGEIREILGFKSDVDHIEAVTLNKPLLRKIYRPREYSLIWLKGNITGSNYNKAIELFSKAEENGLNQRNYDVSKIERRIKTAAAQTIARTDILITELVLKYIDAISNGRGVPENSDIEYYIEMPKRVNNFFLAIEEFLDEDNVDEYIERYSPRHQQYKNLRLALGSLIEKRNSGYQQKFIKDGPDVKVGSRDFRISEIRERFNAKTPISPKAANDKFLYDKELSREIIKFQQRHSINSKGVIDRKTVAALNLTINDKINKIKANMERYRWIPDDLEDTRLMVNIPQYILHAYMDGERQFSQTVIVGREEKKTPIINTVMNEVVFHPYWYVPKNYSLTQLLPHIRNNNYYLYDEEYSVIEVDENGKWTIADPMQIDWFEVDEENFSYIIRQDPGKKNALGPIKFNIVNDLQIYLHGTTEPWLFSSRFRAHSSGCVRVEDPLKLAYYTLVGNSEYDEKQLERLYHAYDNDYEIPFDSKPKHYAIKMEKEIPIYLSYFTLEADENGELTFFNDIYNWDGYFIAS
jgi:murein L,D-transpeptidase YcbB/YkuD